MPRIKIYPDGKIVDVNDGVSFRDALLYSGYEIHSPCGGIGLCGKCSITLISGKILGDVDEDGKFLSCKSFPLTGCEVDITPATIRESEKQPNQRKTGQTERSGDYGVAIDLGTTSVVGALVDLETGKIIEVASVTNPQAKFGEDVISRIMHASTPAGLQELHEAIFRCSNNMVIDLADMGALDVDRVKNVVVAGNAAMNHLLMNVSPDSLGLVPYSPAFRHVGDLPDSGKAIIKDWGDFTLVPNIAGFVGGDTVAGILATGLHKREKPCLFIDIGTNGEIVVGNCDRIIATSTAAGPAFEGGRIECGMRAGPGAIKHVKIGDEISYTTVDGHLPIGICGSGLFEAVGEMLRAGIINQYGKFTSVLQEKKFFITNPTDNPPVYITPKDIAEVQLAKGAVRAGVELLLDEYGNTVDAIDEIIIAGAFGFHLRYEDIRQIGLVPPFDKPKLTLAGNTSLKGAIEVLLKKGARDQIVEIADRVEFMELAGRSDFQDKFTESLRFG